MKGVRVSFNDREDSYILLGDIVRTMMKLTDRGSTRTYNFFFLVGKSRIKVNIVFSQRKSSVFRVMVSLTKVGDYCGFDAHSNLTLKLYVYLCDRI